VATGFSARRNDEIHSCLLERNCLFGAGSRADHDDLAPPALIEQRRRRNAEYETEDWWTSIEHGGGLLFERWPATDWKPRRLQIQLLKEFGNSLDGGCIAAVG
jgi:hypothetical protein